MVIKQMSRYINPLVVVAALGYFVDIYDLILFSIVRIPSLVDMGVPSADLTSVGMMLL
ncbi:MFS transporter, partial [bacterium]|nr:MFS transporter [bacterium]